MPELRKDPIIGRWVIIATERAKRPTDFLFEKKKCCVKKKASVIIVIKGKERLSMFCTVFFN